MGYRQMTKLKRKGVIKCGECGKAVVTGKWTKLFFCPDSGCTNSEEAYMK
jgi:hypothetical protein